MRPWAAQARGVRAMDLAEGDYLVGMEMVEEEGLILSISENGFGKRTPLKRLPADGSRRQGRHQHEDDAAHRQGGGVMAVKEDSDLMIITQDGKIIRLESSEIRQAGRSTQGVRLVRMEEGDRVAAASVISEENGNGNGSNGQEELPLQ